MKGGTASGELRDWMVMRHAGAWRGGKTRAGRADDTVGRAKRAKGVRRAGKLHEAEGWDSAQHTSAERGGEEGESQRSREHRSTQASLGKERHVNVFGESSRVAEGTRYGEAGQNGVVGAVSKTWQHHKQKVCQKRLNFSNVDQKNFVATDVVATSAWLRRWSARDLRQRIC